MANKETGGSAAGELILQKVSTEMQALVDGARSSVVCVGAGKAEPRTGLVIGEGEVVTVARAAEPGEKVPIHTSSGQVDATVVGFDSASGLALLRHSDITGSEQSSHRSAAVGELTVAIACPIPDGHESRLGMVRCVGGATRLPGGRRADSYFQTDSARFRGFSGSVVFAVDGSVLGMTMPVRRREESYVLPIAELLAIAEQLGDGNGSGTAYLGIRTMPIDLPVAVEEFSQGLLVVGVDEESPADSAGVKVGDFLIQVGDIAVPSVESLYDSLVGRKEGESLEIKVADGSGTAKTLTVGVRLR